MKQQLTHVVSNSPSWAAVTGLVVILLVFDGIITSLPFYDLESQQSFKVALFFAVEAFVSAVLQIMYLRIIKKKYSINPTVGYFGRYANITYFIVSLIQYLIIALLIVTILQIEILKQYNSIIVLVSILLSLFLSVGLSAVLAFRFLLWIKYKRDYLIVAYTIAAILLTTNSIFVALFMSLEMQGKPIIIDSSRAAISTTSVRNYDIRQFQANLSFASFVSLWAASIFLLRRYRKKWGTIKFYVIISIPLVYYLGILQFTFSNLLVHYDILNIFQVYTFNVINSILTKPVGGILFGVAFWMVGRSVNNKNISDYMKISALGIVLLSVSNQDAGLYLLPYPPFGLPTITFAGISSYMLFVGLYHSAISISLNSELRKSIEKSVEQEFSFISKLGMSQMEHEIQTRVKRITKRSAKTLEENSGVQVSLESEDIDAYIKLVIKEKEKMLSRNNRNKDDALY
jgi:hypothetical protein